MRPVLRPAPYWGLLFAASLLAVPAAANEPGLAIDAIFESWSAADSPGAAVAVVRDGDVIFEKGYGSAQLEYQIPISPSTIFHVASVSKQFTDFAIVLLAEEGELALDDDVRKHLDWVPDLGRTITIRHLIHHTSGLRDQWELLAMSGWRLDDVITIEHIKKAVARQRELNFEPGTEHLYCNTGYTLLAEIAAKVSGMSFQELTRTRIFEPLGMKSTHFHDDHRHIVPNRAYSYAPSDGGWENSVLSFANTGATSLFTTAPDLGRWLLYLDGHISGEPRVGSEKAIAQMHEKGRLNDGKEIDYAFGLSIGKYRGVASVAHGGADAGFRSFVVRFPEHDLGVVVLSNLASFDVGGTAQKVAEVFLGDSLEPLPADVALENNTEPVSLEPEVLDRFVGRYRLADLGVLVTVTRRGTRLIAEVPGQEPSALRPQSERVFLIKSLGALVTFDQPTAGRAQGFEVVVGGQPSRAERVEAQDLAGLEELAGTYYSPELDTTYRISASADVLVARHQRNPDVDLIALGNDEFASNQWWFGTVRFERDADNEVTGFRVSGGRVRNLLFRRVQ